jgi:excisionase family DNA binding protein
MIEKKLIEFENILVDELTTIIAKKVLDGLQERLDLLQKKKAENYYFSRFKTADYLKVDISTIHNWTKKGKLKAYGLGHRVYFKKDEIDEALIRIN